MLRTLYDAGFRVAINVLPWIPDVTDTAELIARTPADVDMVFAPLQFGADRDGMTLLGRRYTRAEVVERYLADYHRYGHVPNTSWVRPSPPPLENDPLYRHAGARARRPGCRRRRAGRCWRRPVSGCGPAGGASRRRSADRWRRAGGRGAAPRAWTPGRAGRRFQK